MRTWMGAAAVNGFLAVALGAFGTHGLRDRVSERAFAAWETGAHYHLVHAVVLLLVAAATAGGLLPEFIARWCLRLFQAGILLFCGALYLFGMTEVSRWGVVAPVGGLLLMTGWLTLAYAAWSRPILNSPTRLE